MKKNYIKNVRTMTVLEKAGLGLEVGCYIMGMAGLLFAGIRGFNGEFGMAGAGLAVTGIYLLKGYVLKLERRKS